MIFTTAQLETVAVMANARCPADKIAAALGVTFEELTAFAERLARGRAYVEPLTIPARPVRKAPERARLRAERMFLDATETPLVDAAEVEAACRRYSI